jgi:hypothetical protein
MRHPGSARGVRPGEPEIALTELQTVEAEGVVEGCCLGVGFGGLLWCE